MRIAAGILMIIAGLTSPLFFHLTLMDWLGPPTAFEALPLTVGIPLLGSFLSLGLIVGGGICALIKKHWWWALSGAICSIFVGTAISHDPTLRQFWSPMEILLGTLATVFVCLRKREWES